MRVFNFPNDYVNMNIFIHWTCTGPNLIKLTNSDTIYNTLKNRHYALNAHINIRFVNLLNGMVLCANI